MSNLPSLYSSVAVKGKTNRTSSAARAEELGLSCLGYLRAFRHLSTNLGERVPSNAGAKRRAAAAEDKRPAYLRVRFSDLLAFNAAHVIFFFSSR
jgi:hypothetical protein